MYRNHKIALVIPAYNEAKLIRPTLENVPALIDKIYVVDDKSQDKQNEVILECAQRDARITLLTEGNQVNKGSSSFPSLASV